MRLVALVLVSAVLPSRADAPVPGGAMKSLEALRANGAISRIDLYGIPVESETPMRMIKDSLRQGYTYKMEVRDLIRVPCAEGLRRALATLRLEHGGKAGFDLRVALKLTGRHGEEVLLFIDSFSRVIIDDGWVGDGASLVQWMRAELGSCTL